MDDYLKGLSPFDPNGSLSNADADRIWASYKAAGGGRDVSGSLPRGGGLPSGDGGRSIFGSMAGGNGGLASFAGNGGLLGLLRRGGQAVPTAPAVPADGSMQPTIGPGAAPQQQAAAPMPMKLPPGGIIGLLQGQSPQGLMGLLKGAFGGGAAPLAGNMPQAGMIPPQPGMPGSPMAGPVAPQVGPMSLAPPVQLPDINPMNQ